MNLQSQNEEKIRVLQAEIERLAVLLKVIKNSLYYIGYICFYAFLYYRQDLKKQEGCEVLAHESLTEPRVTME